jgi:hypothetical protein
LSTLLSDQEWNELKAMPKKFNDLSPEEQNIALKLLQKSTMTAVTSQNEQLALSHCFTTATAGKSDIDKCLTLVKEGLVRAQRQRNL